MSDFMFILKPYFSILLINYRESMVQHLHVIRNIKAADVSMKKENTVPIINRKI